jgi:GAF domain-containing protein
VRSTPHPSAPPAAQQGAPETARISAPPGLAQRSGVIVKPVSTRARRTGDDLITDLFEACSDLHFLTEPLEATEFVLDLLLESIPSAVALVSFFDINTREFVVVRQAIAAPLAATVPSVILQRVAERSALVTRTMRGGRAVIVNASIADALGQDARWGAIGLELESFACVPVEHGGRYLGLLEVANPIDQAPFTEGDGHALTYIGEQFSEYLAQREIEIDPERVLRPKLAHVAKRS